MWTKPTTLLDCIDLLLQVSSCKPTDFSHLIIAPATAVYSLKELPTHCGCLASDTMMMISSSYAVIDLQQLRSRETPNISSNFLSKVGELASMTNREKRNRCCCIKLLLNRQRSDPNSTTARTATSYRWLTISTDLYWYKFLSATFFPGNVLARSQI